MFSYYGSKSKIVDYYPPPKHKRIIEPFAGSARYSLKYLQNDILLVDKYPLIIDVWHYLQQATVKDIKGLPELKEGDNINNYNITEQERNLLKFCIVQGSASGQNTPSSQYCLRNIHKQNINRIVANLHKIKHWKIIHGSYEDLENEEATWFVDPPYMFGGEYYKESNKNINFQTLAEWCKNRNGQTIVCENTKANWLDFKPLRQIQGARNTKTVEAIWSNHKTNYDAVQQTLQF